MDASRRHAIHAAIVRLADGDRGAFDVLMAELWPAILLLAQRGLGAPHDAEDVAQEVFLRLCSRISEFDRSRDGAAWAFGIAGFEILTQRKRRQRRREQFDVAELERRPDPQASAEHGLLEHERSAALAQMVGELSATERGALGLEPVGASEPRPAPSSTAPATLRKRRQRALDKLRALWRRTHG